jgi:hypothetical protein
MPVYHPDELFNGFRERTLAIISKHKKESVLQPLWQQRTGGPVCIIDDFDTDAFGTFSGTVTRKKNALDTLREKLTAGLHFSNRSFGLASEGSFGPHPHLPFLTCNEELVMLIDFEHDLEITGRAISTETNFSSVTVQQWPEVSEYLTRAQFPEHGIVIRLADGMQIQFTHSCEELQEIIMPCLQRGEPVTLETDMRAMANPTRLRVIGQAMENLLEKIYRVCPDCQKPGYAIQQMIAGLPCAWCGAETRLPKAALYCCTGCGFSETRTLSDRTADPGVCDHCNP